MKKTILIAFAAILSVASFAQDKGVKFTDGTMTEVKAAAKKAGKLIFVDVYATWCGPCKFLASDIFPKEEVGKYMNSTFVNAKFDAEKGEGVAIAKEYAVKGYPTMLILTADGTEISRVVGAPKTPADFIKKVKEEAAKKK